MRVLDKFGISAAAVLLALLSGGCRGKHTAGTDSSDSDADSCVPTCTIPNAHAACGAACAIKSCVDGFADCNGDQSDGCETDIANSATTCGACSNACAQMACTAGTCGTNAAETVWATEPDPAVFLPNDPFIWRMALDESAIYWVSRIRGEVVKAPKAGGPLIRLATQQASVVRLAIDDSYVYWISAPQDPGSTVVFSALVQRVPKQGGTPELVASTTYDSSFQDDLFVDDAYAYWVSSEPGSFGIKRVPKTGGAAQLVRPNGDGGLYAFALSGDSIYSLVTRTAHGTPTFSIEVQPKAGGATTVIAESLDAGPQSRLAVGDTIYMTSATPVEIWEIAKDGLWIRPVPDSRGALDLAFDTTSVYARNDAVLWATDRTTMTRRVLGGRGTPSPFEGRLLVDDKYLYYATIAGIKRIAKE